MHSGADSAGRNENSINTAGCPTSAGLGTPWRWQMLWILQTPSGTGYISSEDWSAGEDTAAPVLSVVWEGDLGSLTAMCWVLHSWGGGLKKCFLWLSNKPNLPFLSSGFPKQLQLQLGMTVNGDFRHAFTSGAWGTAWAEDFRTMQHFCVRWCPVQHHCASVLLLPWPGVSRKD